MAILRIRCARPETPVSAVETTVQLTTLESLLSQSNFGPLRSLICECGKLDANERPGERGLECDVCHVAVADRSMRLKTFASIALQPPIPHPWWPSELLPAVLVLPAGYREDPDSDLNGRYEMILGFSRRNASHMSGPSVQLVYGEPDPISMPTPPIYVEPPITNAAEFVGHALALCAGWLEIPQGATARSLLDGTDEILVDVSELKVRPDDASKEERAYFGLPTIGELVAAMNELSPSRYFMGLRGIPTRLDYLLRTIFVLGSQCTFTLDAEASLRTTWTVTKNAPPP